MSVNFFFQKTVVYNYITLSLQDIKIININNEQRNS